MALREDTARDEHHEPARRGRHGRPRPFGGRLRLPTLRFSGAAMAMSTVVGISIATTLLLNEQQGVGRRAGVARVGTTPPPTPGTDDRSEAATARTPAAEQPAGRTPAAHPVTGRPSGPHAPAHPAGAAPVAATGSASASPSAGTAHPTAPQASGGPGTPDAPSTAGQTPADGTSGPATPSVPPGTATEASGSAPADGVAGPAPAESPSPTVPHTPGPRPVSSPHPGPLPAAAVPGADDTGTPAPADALTPDASDADQALTGTALVTPLGRDGTRHALELTVTEAVTALQTEFRLAPGELAPGSGTAWTDLPGAVVTAQQERGTLVYRFTTPAGTDVRPGHYTFTVLGTRPTAGPVAAAAPAGPAAPSGPAGSALAARKPAAAESWSAAAFGIDHPRAVAALGSFGPAASQTPDAQPPGLPPKAAPTLTPTATTRPVIAPPVIAPTVTTPTVTTQPDAEPQPQPQLGAAQPAPTR
ncbi:hypothetical protein [Kitasatospora sp. NPDC097643]|uniref:hypothetical protein n=1 Tax=Kitasatospora sp. NPDC097643 TaxID=3157230 RepID=UPI00331767E5